jgi:tRNA-dihydrouridine synthase 3
VSSVPITMKTRTGYFKDKRVTANLIHQLAATGISSLTVHGRSREQRYTKLADYEYLRDCYRKCRENELSFFANGDIYTPKQYYANLEYLNGEDDSSSVGIMIARGALIKPWIFTEIKERRDWDISSKERFEILQKFVSYGFELWGTDDYGLEQTRRYLLEWLSFLHRYVPVGLTEVIPAMNSRPDAYVGRDELEILMSSAESSDWVKLSVMLLGPVGSGFAFSPRSY